MPDLNLRGYTLRLERTGDLQGIARYRLRIGKKFLGKLITTVRGEERGVDADLTAGELDLLHSSLEQRDGEFRIRTRGGRTLTVRFAPAGPNLTLSLGDDSIELLPAEATSIRKLIADVTL